MYDRFFLSGSVTGRSFFSCRNRSTVRDDGELASPPPAALMISACRTKQNDREEKTALSELITLQKARPFGCSRQPATLGFYELCDGAAIGFRQAVILFAVQHVTVQFCIVRTFPLYQSVPGRQFLRQRLKFGCAARSCSDVLLIEPILAAPRCISCAVSSSHFPLCIRFIRAMRTLPS